MRPTLPSLARALTLVCGLLLAHAAHAAPPTFHTLTLSDGATVEVGVVQPASGEVDPAKVALLLPPATGTKKTIQLAFDPWAAGIAEAGWLVVSPTTIDGQLWFAGSEVHTIPLLDAMKATFGSGDVVHLVGISNGGISVFRLAALHPTRFRSVVALPGQAFDEDIAKASGMKPLKVTMVIGTTDDERWRYMTKTTSDKLRAKGVDVLVVPIEGEGHHVWASRTWAQVVGWMTR